MLIVAVYDGGGASRRPRGLRVGLCAARCETDVLSVVEVLQLQLGSCEARTLGGYKGKGSYAIRPPWKKACWASRV